MAESIMDCQQCSKDLRRQGFVETYALGSDLEGALELEGMFCVGCFSKMPDWSRTQYRYCSPTGDFLSRGWSFTTELHLMECIERYFWKNSDSGSTILRQVTTWQKRQDSIFLNNRFETTMKKISHPPFFFASSHSGRRRRTEDGGKIEWILASERFLWAVVPTNEEIVDIWAGLEPQESLIWWSLRPHCWRFRDNS